MDRLRAFLQFVSHPIDTTGEIFHLVRDVVRENGTRRGAEMIFREVGAEVSQITDNAEVFVDEARENGIDSAVQLVVDTVDEVADPQPPRFSEFPETYDARREAAFDAAGRPKDNFSFRPQQDGELLDEDLIVLTVYNTGRNRDGTLASPGHVSLQYGGYVVDHYPQNTPKIDDRGRLDMGDVFGGNAAAKDPSGFSYGGDGIAFKPGARGADEVTYVMTKDQLRQYLVHSGKSQEEADQLVNGLTRRTEEESNPSEPYHLRDNNCAQRVCEALFGDRRFETPQTCRRFMNGLVQGGYASAVRYDDPGLQAYHRRTISAVTLNIKRGEQAPAPEEHQGERDEGRDGAANQPSLRRTISAAQREWREQQDRHLLELLRDSQQRPQEQPQPQLPQHIIPPAFRSSGRN